MKLVFVASPLSILIKE